MKYKAILPFAVVLAVGLSKCGQWKLQQIVVKTKLSVLMWSFLSKWPLGNNVQGNKHNPDFEMHRTFYFGPNYC